MAADPSQVAQPPQPQADPTIVTDPNFIKQLQGDDQPQPQDAPGGGNSPVPVGGTTSDAEFIRQLQQSNHAGESHMSTGSRDDREKAPFMDRMHIAQARNFDEKLLYMQKQYGAKNVYVEHDKKGEPQLRVTMPDGKQFRITDGGFWAQLAGNSPVAIGAAAGGMYGAEVGSALGPAGTVAGTAIGGGIGGMVGEVGLMTQKKAEGLSTPGHIADDINAAAREGFDQEAMGGAIGEAGKTIMASHLPHSWFGVTDESVKASNAAHAAGARPSWFSMAPDAKKLQRVEIVAQGLLGKNAQQVADNKAYIISELKDSLKRSGMPQPFIDETVSNALDENLAAASRESVGETIKKGVQNHIDALTESLGKQTNIVDSQIDAQLKSVGDMVDDKKHIGLTETLTNAVKSARRDLGEAASTAYGRIDEALGGAKIIDKSGLREYAQTIIANEPLRAQGIVKKLAAEGHKMSPEDAMLFEDFGVDPGETGDKITLTQAQHIRTILREKADANTAGLTKGPSSRQYTELAGKVDEAIDKAEGSSELRPYIKAFRDTNAWYKKNLAKFKDQGLRTVAKQLEDGVYMDAGKVVSLVSQPGYSSRVKAVRSMMGEAEWPRVQSMYMDQFLNGISVTSKDLGREVDGIKLLDKLRDHDQRLTLEQMYDKETVEQLREIGRNTAARNGKVNVDKLQAGNVKGALEEMQVRQKALDDYMGKNIVKELSEESKKTNGAAFEWLVQPGTEGAGRLIEMAKLFPVGTPQMTAIRQAALESVARNVRLNVIEKEGTSGISKALDAYTPEQQKILFAPETLEAMRFMQKTINFMFPHAADPGAAALTIGQMQNKPFVHRQIVNVTNSLMRMIVLNPKFARSLLLGRDYNRNSVQWAGKLFRGMARGGMGGEENIEDQE